MIPPEAKLPEDKVLEILDKVKPIFEKEPSLIKVETKKAVFIGDTHGDFESSKYVFDNFDPKQYTLTFLGDYVDRGPQQLKNIIFLFQKKLENPDKVILLRGNHETQETNRFYGFLNELLELYKKDALMIWKKFNEIFSFMSYGCLVNGEILAIHGGLASGLTTLEQMENLPKGEINLTNPIVFQLLWNDPEEGIKGFIPSNRGKGVMLFGRDVVEDFAARNKILLIIRSHEPIPEGAKYLFTTSTTKNKLSAMLKKIFGRVVEYPGLVLSVFTCRYYEGCNPAVAILEGRKVLFKSLIGGEI